MTKRSKKFKKIRRKIRYPLILGLVRFMIFISRLFPRKTWLALCGFLGGMAFHVASRSRKLATKHLKMAYGKEKSEAEIKAIAKQVFVMMGKNAGDIIRAFKVHTLEDFNKIRVVHGVEIAERAFAKGKGVIFLTAHFGAFEFVATELAFRGYKPLIIGTPMKDERLTNLLWEQRNKLGASAIERGKETVRLIKSLKSGGTIAILIDQDTRVKSVFVDFFGMPCATPIGATLLALRTGAAIVPIFYHLREDGMQEANFYPEVELTITGDEETDMRVNTQRLSDVIEAEIRKHPAQWLWLHERWKTKPGEEIQ
ncbi:MAG: lysophospholipid acyltransferase family protein [Cyclobacteriaceae bacterium]|nr:lysophospholipid acyltransferase family protein [Cyclobacteriaceae bacterium]